MAMHVYTGSAQHADLALAKNVLVLTPASGYKIILFSASITNETNETNEQLLASLYEASAAGTGAATAVTKVAQTIGDGVASTSTLEHTYATTEPTLEAAALWSEGFATLVGWNYVPLFEETIIIPYPKILVMRIETTSWTAVTLRARMTWGEVGLTDQVSAYSRANYR